MGYICGSQQNLVHKKINIIPLLPLALELWVYAIITL